MVFAKAKSIEQLKREIAEQQKRISSRKLSSEKTSERIKLQRQLFELRNARLISAGKKAKRLSSKFGRGLLAAGKKAIPIVKKQTRLIREQQLRDEAIEKRLKKGKSTTKTITKFVPLKKGSKKFKKIQVKVKIPKARVDKKSKARQQGLSIFQSLDF